MRVAIVHDWLYTIGGAERVLRELLACYPGADVFTLFDVLTPEQRSWIGYETSHTSFLQQVPGIGRIHRSLLPLMPLAIEQLDLTGYDLIVSSSYAVAKGVISGPDQLHVAYVHSPMRYAWDLQHQYLKETGRGPKNILARVLLHRIRIWDASSGLRPDAIVANSAFVGRRIRKAFGRDARVIYPPVDVTPASPNQPRERHFLAAGRLVGYKNARAIVEAFQLLPDLHLIVAGTGPDEALLRGIGGSNVSFAGFVPDAEMRRLMASARAVILAAEEDFGIVAVEAQAEGTPIIALGRGGARENVVADGPAATGLYFNVADAQHIASAVNTFVSREPGFTREACQRHARTFSAERFRSQIKAFIDDELRQSPVAGRVPRGVAASQLSAAE